MRTERKILFKAVRRDNNEWVLGSLIISTVTREEYYHIQEENTVGFRYCFPINPKTLCQYVTTVNDVDLYDGDIIHENGCHICWSTDLLCWCFKHTNDNFMVPLYYDMENINKVTKIFGNIHDGRRN